MKPVVIYSIGHSNQSIESFLALLADHQIAVLVDVRSRPYSRYSPHFNLEDLERSVERAGVRFVYRGGDLGGRPEGREFYDSEGRVRYAQLAQADFFQAGIACLLDLGAEGKTAVMCSEEDPAGCHRRLLIGRVLDPRGVRMLHIRGDGRVGEEETFGRKPQLSLLGQDGDSEWKSTRSVLPSERLPASSGH